MENTKTMTNETNTQEFIDAEQEFKRAMACVFARQISEVTLDKDGYICIPGEYVLQRQKERMRKDTEQ